MHHQAYSEDNVEDSADTAAESSRFDRYNKYNENLRSQLDETQSMLEESLAENVKLAETIKKGFIPTVSYQNFDINDYIDHPCVYLIHLIDNDYKFGETGEIDRRYYRHKNDFKKKGCDPKVVKIWICKTMKIMKHTEKKIKNFAEQNKIKVRKYGQTEILQTDNIEPVIKVIDKYVEEHNAKDELTMKLRLAEIELECKKYEVQLNVDLPMKIRFAEIELESRKLGVQIKQMDVNILKDKIELLRLEQLPNRKQNIVIEIHDSTESETEQHDEIAPVVPIAPVIPNVPDNIGQNNANPVNAAHLTKHQRNQIAKQWIANNNPRDNELTTIYYERYKAANGNFISHKLFGPIAREILNREYIRGVHGQHW